MKIYTNEELQDLTEKWGFSRKITINGNIPTQTLKFGEEMGELFEAESVDEKKDAIGDMIVVLSMIANLNFTSLLKCLELTDKEAIRISNETRLSPNDKLAASYGKLCSLVVRGQFEKIDLIIREILIIMVDVAIQYSTTINECWSLAYEEIKDRRGTLLENGNFVKD